MKKLTVFIDESGDLGAKGSDYFTMAAVVVDSGIDSQLVGRAIKKTLQWKGKRRHFKLSELKFSHVSRNIGEYLSKKLEHIPFDVYGVVLKKNQSAFNNRSPKSQRYLYEGVLLQLLQQVPFRGVSVCYVILDKRGNRYHRDMLAQRLQKSFEENSSNLQLQIAHMDSQRERGIQLADIFCGAIHLQAKGGKSDWLSLNRHRIRKIAAHRKSRVLPR